MTPVIGITGRPRTIDTAIGSTDVVSVEQVFVDAVADAGGAPLLLTPVASDHVPLLADRLDGVVFSGGGDIHPDRYGGRMVSQLYDVDLVRDEFEIALMLEAQRRQIPTFAICRGLQVLNVALGGTLVEDIPSELGTEDHHAVGSAVHTGFLRVAVDDGSRVSGILDASEVWVNPIHHQAVRDLAPGLRAVGRSDDGVIEVLEAVDPGWRMTAVQWHPEFLAGEGDKPSALLFERLVADARERLAR